MTFSCAPHTNADCSFVAPQRPAAKVAPKMAPSGLRRPGSSGGGDDERAELVQEVYLPLNACNVSFPEFCL